MGMHLLAFVSFEVESCVCVCVCVYACIMCVCVCVPFFSLSLHIFVGAFVNGMVTLAIKVTIVFLSMNKWFMFELQS